MLLNWIAGSWCSWETTITRLFEHSGAWIQAVPDRSNCKIEFPWLGNIIHEANVGTERLNPEEANLTALEMNRNIFWGQNHVQTEQEHKTKI